MLVAMSRSLRLSRCEAVLSIAKASSCEIPWVAIRIPTAAPISRLVAMPCSYCAARSECPADAMATELKEARTVAIATASSSNAPVVSLKRFSAPVRLPSASSGTASIARTGVRATTASASRGQLLCSVMSLSTWTFWSVLASRHGPSRSWFCSSSISRITSSVAAPLWKRPFGSRIPMAARSHPSTSWGADSTTIACTSVTLRPSRSRCASTANWSCGPRSEVTLRTLRDRAQPGGANGLPDRSGPGGPGGGGGGGACGAGAYDGGGGSVGG